MELKRTNKFGKIRCACCGCYTITEIADICEVCYWEESIYQEEINTEDDDAPNYISFKEAKENYLKFGAIKLELKSKVREPNVDELPPSLG